MKDQSAPEMATQRISRRKLLTFGWAMAALGVAGGFLYRHFSSTSQIHVESFTTNGIGDKKNILLVTGSARDGGNTEILADAFANGARAAGHTVNVFNSGKNPMLSCMHCDGCWSNGEPCVVRDSFTSFWPVLEQADMLVLASPLYWYNFSGHIKCAIDRMYPYSRNDRKRDLKIREAMLLMCGESHFPRSFAGAAEAYRQILGFKRWTDRGRLFVTGFHEYGDIKNGSALVMADKMGRNA
ncbi:MAG: flavodoxin family protein [Desulfovibrio sp.]|jgi:NAD(P)H-dependent FMN reductase